MHNEKENDDEYNEQFNSDDRSVEFVSFVLFVISKNRILINLRFKGNCFSLFSSFNITLLPNNNETNIYNLYRNALFQLILLYFGKKK